MSRAGRAWDDSGGATPEHVGEAESVDRLRDENAELRRELAALKESQSAAPAPAEGEWPREIIYDQLSVSPGKVLAQLGGVTKQRMKEGRIPNSAEFGYLPKPSDDEEQLQADYLRWGYCRASAQIPLFLASLLCAARRCAGPACR